MWPIIKNYIYENGKQYPSKDLLEAIKTAVNNVKYQVVDKLRKSEYQGSYINM